MKITVALCTYNRCRSLAKALDSVARSTVPEFVEWEVLVVDNNSTDQTRQVSEEFYRQYPDRLRYIFEPHQGKSYALNTAIQNARGEVLAFMDDDVTVEPTWLQNLTRNLDGGEWCGAGGRILPARAFTPPPWLPLRGPFNMGGVLALFDLGEAARELDRPPFGTNMAFRKEIFQKYGGFRTDLGPFPGNEIRNEDTEFGRRLLAAGERIRYEPSAVVYHAVPEQRLTKKYFLAFWFGLGRADIRETTQRPDIWGIQRRYLTMLKHLLVLAPLKTVQWLLALGPQTRFYRKCWVWYTVGEIVEIYRRWFVPNGKEKNALRNVQGTPGVNPPERRGTRSGPASGC
jgi:glycosyltransferase involved in cell wall biosynthesis